MHRHFAFLSAAWLALPAQAQTIEVDLELVLMVDVSRSMTQNELEIQRQEGRRWQAQAGKVPPMHELPQALVSRRAWKHLGL